MKSQKPEDIVRVATQKFALHGFSGASTPNIAKESNVAQPHIYYFFKDKMELWKECVRRCIADKDWDNLALFILRELHPIESGRLWDIKFCLQDVSREDKEDLNSKIRQITENFILGN